MGYRAAVEGAGCCPHDFQPEKGGHYRCSGCRVHWHSQIVVAYEQGVEHGRRSAWSRPPTSKAPRWAVALVVSLGLPLVGAGPVETLPPPQGLVVREAAGKCTRAARLLERDVEVVWGRELSRYCKDAACRARAAEEAKNNRVRVATAAAEADEAGYQLSRVQENAVPCAKNQIPGCAAYMAPLLVDREARLLERCTRLEEEAKNYNLARDLPP